MVTVMMNAVPELKFGTVGACSDACCSLLISIANIAMLDEKITVIRTRIRSNQFQLTDAVDVTMLAK